MKIDPKILLGLLVIPVLFFLASFLTLSDYGISWDEPIHFTRGQAYLNYFLTGDLDYQNLKSSDRRSLYQESSFTGRFFLKNDSGHPPVNGMLAALSNLIFYQKLGVLGDIESYHLFNILSATLLVAVVTLFAAQTYGLFVAVVAGLSLVVYPLFFAESHFNIKDPAEAAFYAGTIWAFWNSLKRYDWRWLLLAILFFALALGTKFNILFLPSIIILWLVWKNPSAVFHPFRVVLKTPRFFLLLLTVSWILIGAIFFLTWPYLWQNPLAHTLNIFLYYKEIGTGGLGQPQFITWGGFNLFPTTWILTTTPPFIIFLTILGILAAFRKKDRDKTAILWLIWLIIPILRVSIPGSSIYGGVRQIMEFIPAMALLSGLGASLLLSSSKRFFVFWRLPENVLVVVIFLVFIPHLLVMVKLHPNENVYFNFLIGGLKGAEERNIPYWGNSFGNAYFQAVQWLNVNAPKESMVALLQGTMVNIPKIYFRSDIHFSNSFWSGVNRKGEYLVDLTHQGYQVAYPAVWEYVETVLDPVYEVKVDGVAIAKIWKNDIEHSKPGFKSEQDIVIKQINRTGQVLDIELEDAYYLTRLNIQFNPDGDCQEFKQGIVKTSVNGKSWNEESEKIGEEQVKDYLPLEKGIVRYLLPVDKARYVQIQTETGKSCLFNNTQLSLRGFKI